MGSTGVRVCRGVCPGSFSRLTLSGYALINSTSPEIFPESARQAGPPLTASRRLLSSSTYRRNLSDAIPNNGESSKKKSKKQRTRAEEKNLTNAQKFAQAMKQKRSLPFPSSPTGDQELPVTESETGSQPDIEDFQRIVARPKKRDRLKEYKERKKLYDEVFKRVEGAFTVKQLRMIESAYLESEGQRRRKEHLGSKMIVIQRLLVREGWETPIDESLQYLTETKFFNLPANEMFSFLRDMKLLRSLMIDRGMTISIASSKKDPKKPILEVYGARKYLDYLQTALEARRSHMTISTIPLSQLQNSRLSEQLLQFISFRTGTHVELVGDNYRLSAMNPSAVEMAQRLMHVAAVRTHTPSTDRSLIALYPTTSPLPSEAFKADSTQVSLVPFFSSPSNTIPWHLMRTTASSLLYRLKRVMPWSFRQSLACDFESVGKFKDRSVLDLESTAQTAQHSIKDHLSNLTTQNPFSSSGGASTTISFGHMILPSTSSSPLSAPFSGAKTLESLPKLLHERPIFIPGLTQGMLQFSSLFTYQRSRRLQYRSPSTGQILTFNYTYPSTAVNNDSKETESEAMSNWMKQLDKQVAEMIKEGKRKRAEAAEVVEDALNPSPAESDEADMPPSSPDARVATMGDMQTMLKPMEIGKIEDVVIDAEISSVKEIDMLIPDSSIDGRMSLAITKSLSNEEIPRPIRLFFDELVSASKPLSSKKSTEDGIDSFSPEEAGSSQPTPVAAKAPLTITVDSDEESFILESDEEEEISSTEVVSGLRRRLIRSMDQIVADDKVVSYTELICDQSPPSEAFWNEVGRMTSDQTIVSELDNHTLF